MWGRGNQSLWEDGRVCQIWRQMTWWDLTYLFGNIITKPIWGREVLSSVYCLRGGTGKSTLQGGRKVSAMLSSHWWVIDSCIWAVPDPHTKTFFFFFFNFIYFTSTLHTQVLATTVHVTQRNVDGREQTHISNAITANCFITAFLKGKSDATACAPPPP